MVRGKPKARGRGRPSTRSIDRKPIRPLERQRMRPWLTQMLDNDTCSQLVWINRNDSLFRIAWKHAAGQTFDPVADATLFERWATHTGKFYAGDQPDPKRWKANFRCALNSLLDVEEDKSKGVKKGNDAFKVYRFLDEKRPKKSKKAREAMDEGLDKEIQVLYKSQGTKSRPKVPTGMELDSEGSEGASSPSPMASDSGSSDWDDMTSNDLRCHSQEADSDREASQKSPLPDFEKLCQTANLFGLGGNLCVQKSPSPPPRQPEAYSPQRPVEMYSPPRQAETYSPAGPVIVESFSLRSADCTYSPTYSASYSPTYSADIDEVCSNTSSSHSVTEEESLEELILVDGGDINWNDFLKSEDIFIQEAPETVIGGEETMVSEAGPNVIVLAENHSSHDYVFTSMAEL